MAFRAETQPWVGRQTKTSRTFDVDVPLEWIIARPRTLMDTIRSAAATGVPRDIDRAKAQAWKEGKLKGIFAEVVLFNAEK